MKQPPYTTPPLAGKSAQKLTLRQMLLGHLASDAYYEAHRNDNGVYLLWMEFSRFGRLLCYPCVLAERDGEPLVFRPGDDGGNRALLDRWNELVTPETFETFRFAPLKKEAFGKIYAAYRRGEA